MASDTEHQQVAVALMEESEDPSSKKVQEKCQTNRSKKKKRKYFTGKYLVGYGIPIVILILVILLFILVFIGIRKYNRNCKHHKNESCRGIRWFFT